MIDYTQAPLGYLVRVPDHVPDSVLTVADRERFEAAGSFLRFERIGQIVSLPDQVSKEIAQILWLSTSRDFADDVELNEHLEDPEISCGYLLSPQQAKTGLAGDPSLNDLRGLPCVILARQQGIANALARLGVLPSPAGPSIPQQANTRLAGDPASSFENSADVCTGLELVAPGGIISIHRDREGKFHARARTMIVNFDFTDFVKAVEWRANTEEPVAGPQ